MLLQVCFVSSYPAHRRCCSAKHAIAAPDGSQLVAAPPPPRQPLGKPGGCLQRRAMRLFDGVMHLPCCRPQIGILAHALHTSQHTVGSTCTTATTGLALHRECACVTDQPEASVTEKIWHLAIISNNRIRLHRGATAASATFAARSTMLFTATGHTLLMRSATTSGQSCGVFGRCVLPRIGASLQRQSKSAHQHVMSIRT